MAETMGAQPVYNVGGTQDGLLGGGAGGIWVLLLFILLLGGAGAGGLLGRNATDAIVADRLSNEFLYNNLNTTMQTNFAMLNKGQSDIQLQMCQGFGAMTHQIDLGLCEVKQTILNDGNATRALINNIELENWRQRALSAENRENNSAQTATIVNAIRPYPTAAYLAPNPATFGDGHVYGHKFWA